MEVQVKWSFNYRKEILGILILFAVSFSGLAQKPIKGIVIDSISFSPLSNVNILVKNTNRGTATDQKGEFRIVVRPFDTLVFSLVGYLTEEFAAAELEETTLIRLAEQVRLLQTVNVYAKKEEKKPRSLSLHPKGALMNYGPSGAGVNFAYWSKGEREKRKLSVVVARQEHEKNYNAVVTSPEVKERIIYDYNLSEEEYYQILAGFNIENGSGLYNLSEEELIVVMNNYFKRYAHRR